MQQTRPLSVSGQRLKAIFKEGRDTQVGVAAYLRCDQSTVSKWVREGSIPSLALAVALEMKWPEVTVHGWVQRETELGRYRPRIRGDRGTDRSKLRSGRGRP